MESSGKWIKDNNYLILNSDLKSKLVPLNITLKEPDKEKKGYEPPVVNVKLNANGKNESNYTCLIHVNGISSIFKTDPGSYSVKVVVPIDSIYFMIWKDPFADDGTRSAIEPLKSETVYFDHWFYEEINIEIDLDDSLFITGYLIMPL